MTKLPHESWRVVPATEEPRYKVAPQCANPMCRRPADHAHHIWRRSFIGGDFAWVTLDGKLIGNLCGLCWQCHQRITDNLDWIQWTDEGHFVYWSGEGRNGPDMRLHPHPPLGGAKPTAYQTTIDGREVPHDTVVKEMHAHYGETCDSCNGTGRKKTRKKDDLPPGEKRPRATWAVSVPKDERENGAAVLDELMEECRVIFNRADEKSWKYFTLIQALVFSVQHRHVVAADHQEAA